MGDDSKLSVNNMVEFAMGLSMASLFTNAMSTTMQNTARSLNNDQVAAPYKYIHVVVNGQSKGPLAIGEIVSMIQSGDITMDSYMWKPGMAEWKMAKDITDIGLNFEAVPPQMPKL